MCTNGRGVESVVIRRKNNKEYLYGVYYEGSKTRFCYIGPADPKNILYSMPYAYPLNPDAWRSILRSSLVELVNNINDEGELRALYELITGVAKEIEEALGKVGNGEDHQAATRQAQGQPSGGQQALVFKCRAKCVGDSAYLVSCSDGRVGLVPKESLVELVNRFRESYEIESNCKGRKGFNPGHI